VNLFADTNWLVAAYFRKKAADRSAIVQRHSIRVDLPWFISSPVWMECENTFRTISADPNPAEWVSLQEDLGDRIEMPENNWDTICTKAKELMRRFSHQGRLGTMDVMILASALKLEATHFLSFDTNSHARALAAVLKLKVYPDLTGEDKARMASFR